MLDDYKDAFRQCADLIDGWQELSKNDLCRKYVENSGNPEIQNSYFAAIMYRYWNLIAKYYYQSSNVASPEDCYEWLEDSVYGCLKATSWDRKDSSIYNDPNGPDKVINRCMKCARLTYYQFINRKKRKDDFGLLSLDELNELFGNAVHEPLSDEGVDMSSWVIEEYIRNAFKNKDYFVAVMLDQIQNHEVFDSSQTTSYGMLTKFNVKKLTRFMSNITDEYVLQFAERYNIPYEEAHAGIEYFRNKKSPTIKAKIQLTLERLQHDEFFCLLNGGN